MSEKVWNPWTNFMIWKRFVWPLLVSSLFSSPFLQQHKKIGQTTVSRRAPPCGWTRKQAALRISQFAPSSSCLNHSYSVPSFFLPAAIAVRSSNGSSCCCSSRRPSSSQVSSSILAWNLIASCPGRDMFSKRSRLLNLSLCIYTVQQANYWNPHRK